MTKAWQMSLDGQNDKRDREQALIQAKEFYAMKLDPLSSATVVDGAVKFVSRHRGLIPQSTGVLKEVDSAELIESTG